MGKRGQYIVVYSLIGLTIAALTVIALTSLVTRLGSDTTLEREYVSKDLALLLDTIYASPGDLEYTYSLPEHFQISIGNHLVTVKDAEKRAKSTHYYASSHEFNELKFSSDGAPRAIKITKKRNEIAIKGIYNDNERSAIRKFRELTEFVKGSTKRSYNFKCIESYPIVLEKGYYIIISGNGNSALYYSSEDGTTEISTETLPQLNYIETNGMETYIITPDESMSSWNWIMLKDEAVIINNEKTRTWQWATPTIEIKELPKCEAENMAR
ncbi:hypothetical protein HYU11_01510 [Candidatus Woesearchaeota archaeon]|nr:hypothetical protein [Candidatus Woesearchaeota archaeon]